VTASATFTPSNPAVRSTPRCQGTGFTANATTQILVNGKGSSSSTFQAKSDGSFDVGRRMPSTAGVYPVVIRQLSGSSYVDKWTGDITVGSPAPPPTLTAPGTPTGLTLTAGDTAIAARCVAPVSDGGSPITGYSWKLNGTVVATTPSTAYNFGGLTNGTSYTVAVAAINAIGTSSYTSTASATPAASVPGPEPGGEPAEASPTETATLAAAIAAGGSVSMLDRIYRLAADPTHALVLTASGAGKAEIRGSDIWTGWSGTGPWVSTLTVPALSMHDNSDGRYSDSQWPEHAGVRWPEQVFVDSVPFTQIDPGLVPGANQFKIDSGRHVVLGSNPSGHRVEVTTRRYWLHATASLTVHGARMRHAANEAQAAAAALIVKNGGRAIFDQGAALLHCHGTLLGIVGGSGHQLTDLELGYGGQNGYAFTGGIDGLLGQRLNVHHANERYYNPLWEAGAGKTTDSNGVVIDLSLFEHIFGVGPWWDLAPNTGAVLRRSKMRFIDFAGAMYEISAGWLCEDNVLYECGWGDPRGGGWPWGPAILVSSSSHATVRRNVIAWCRGGITFINQTGGNRATIADRGTNYVQNDNVIVGRPSEYLLGGFQDWAGPQFTTTTDKGGTAVGGGALGGKYWTGGSMRFAWGGDKDLAGINATPIEEGGAAISTAARDAILTPLGVPLSGSH
jgi:hypothetical protein